jgi:hypothetical protein
MSDLNCWRFPVGNSHPTLIIRGDLTLNKAFGFNFKPAAFGQAFSKLKATANFEYFFTSF